MKKIFYLLLTVIAIISIYSEYGNKRYNYVSLANEAVLNNRNYNDYVKEYLTKNNKLDSFNNYFSNNSINGLIEDIKSNRTIRIKENEYYLKKVLRESNLVVIDICMKKVIDNYSKYDINKNYRLFNKMIIEIENLIKEIKKYAKGDILFLGIYNPTNYYDSKTDELFYEYNVKLNNISKKYSVYYIDLYENIKNNQYKDYQNQSVLNSYGNKMISDIIESYLK